MEKSPDSAGTATPREPNPSVKVGQWRETLGVTTARGRCRYVRTETWGDVEVFVHCERIDKHGDRHMSRDEIRATATPSTTDGIPDRADLTPDDMKAIPTYTRMHILIEDRLGVVTCKLCGAAVLVDTDPRVENACLRHTDWHRALRFAIATGQL